MRIFPPIFSLLLLLASPLKGATILYGNDFDTIATTATGVTGTVSGGTQTTAGQTGGETDGQGFNALPEFSGDLFRVTTEDDRLIIQISGIQPNSTVTTEFALAMIDSWDGGNSRWGTDIINMEIHDGGTVVGNTIVGGTVIAEVEEAYSNPTSLSSTGYVETVLATNTQYGFNNGEPWWREDALSIKVDNLLVTTGTLTFSIWASSGGTGTGFQGGNDESFGIDNFQVTLVPEPSTSAMFSLSVLLMAKRRRKK